MLLQFGNVISWRMNAGYRCMWVSGNHMNIKNASNFKTVLVKCFSIFLSAMLLMDRNWLFKRFIFSEKLKEASKDIPSGSTSVGITEVHGYKKFLIS